MLLAECYLGIVHGMITHDKTEQMDRSFDLLRHQNGTYTLTMLTDEGLPGGLILRPLVGGELWYNFDIGFNLVSDDYGRQDMGFGGGERKQQRR